MRWLLLVALLIFSGCDTEESNGVEMGTHWDYDWQIMIPYGRSMYPYLKGDIPIVVVKQDWEEVKLGSRLLFHGEMKKMKFMDRCIEQ